MTGDSGETSTEVMYGLRVLWMLKAALDEPSKDRSLVEQAKAG